MLLEEETQEVLESLQAKLWKDRKTLRRDQTGSKHKEDEVPNK